MSAAILTITRDGETIKSVPIEGEALLGRSEGCVIRLEDRAISRQHAVFRMVAGGVQVEKKSEFAPLSVNGAECTRATLKEGDVIAIGPYLMRLASAKVEAIPAPVPVAAGFQPAPGVVAPAPAPLSDPVTAEPVLSQPAAAAIGDALPDLADLGDSGDLGSAQAADHPASAAAAQGPLDLKLGGTDGDDIDLSAPIIGADDGPDALNAGLGDDAQPKLEATSDLAPNSDGLGGSDDILAPNVQLTPTGNIKAPLPEELAGNINGNDFGSLGGIEAPSLDFADGDAKTKVVSQSKVMAKLHFADGIANVRELELNDEEVSLGRGKNCSVILEDKKASRKHAIIRRSGLAFVIKDLESANGTFVNGVQVGEQELYGGDLIRIGNSEFRFEALSSDYIARQGDFLPVPQEPESAAQNASAFPSPIDSPMTPEAAFNSGMGAPGVGAGAAAGIPGISVSGPAKKQTLLEKFRALPKGRQMIWTFIIIGILYFAFFDDDEPQKPAPKKPVAASMEKGPATFESLTPEQQKFVVSEHALAFEYYKGKEYDKSLFELAKIFALVPDYKDSREIERYAKEGQRKLQAFEEERRKKEEEEKLKARIAELVDETKGYMDKKNYDKASDMFPQILALDPDNTNVTAWSKEVEKFEEDQRIKAEERAVQDQINAHAWEIYREGVEERKEDKFQDAMATFGKVQDIGASDKKVLEAAQNQIKEIIAQVAALRDPVLDAAKQAEDNQDFPKAYELYEKATKIDPPHPAGYAGMARIRDILHDRAKGLYIEAVLAESYSDFTTSKKKFLECLQVAPKDDIYHDRAERKLASYFDNTSSGDGQQQ